MLAPEGKAETKGVKQVLATCDMKGPMGSKARKGHSAKGRRRAPAILGSSGDEEEGQHPSSAAKELVPLR
jgi:hypothetical protein